MKRKIGNVVVMVIMLLAFMTGCAKKQVKDATQEDAVSKKEPTATVTPTATPTAMPTATPAVEQKNDLYNIVWYMYGTAPEGVNEVITEVNNYLPEKIGATLEMRFLGWGEYDNELEKVLSTGEKFDLCFTASWLSASSYRLQAANEKFLAIDELLMNQGSGILELTPDTLWNGIKVNGKIYGVPVNKELAHQWSVLINAEAAAKAGITIPKTFTSYKELGDMLTTVKEKLPEYLPIDITGRKNLLPSLPFERVDSSIPVGVNPRDTEPEMINQIETEEFKNFIYEMRDWYNNGLIQSDAAGSQNYDSLVKEGKWFAYLISGTPYCEISKEQQYGVDIVRVPVQEAVIYNSDCGGAIQAISVTSENPEKVMEFLNLLNTDVYLRNLLGYGVEGVNYEKAGENVIKNISNYSMPNWALANRLIEYIDSNTPTDIWKAYDDFNKGAEASTILGFSFNPSGVTSEIEMIQAVNNQYMSAILTGALDPEEYLPKLIDAYRVAGIDKILAEAQKQLEEWLEQ